MRPSSPSSLLATTGSPAFLVTDLTNIRYLTGLQISAGAVLVTSRRTLLFVDARYKEIAESGVRAGVTVRDVSDLAKMMMSIPVCGFESEDVTVERQSHWKKKYPST